MLLLFVVVVVRKDWISVCILAFLQGPMSVRSGKFSVYEQIKKSRHFQDTLSKGRSRVVLSVNHVGRASQD